MKISTEDLKTNIKISTSIGLKQNNVRKATVKSVSYIAPENSTINQQEIHLETVEGLRTPSSGWFINNHCLLYVVEFSEAREKILSGAISEGTEITVVYNSNGIMYFYI